MLLLCDLSGKAYHLCKDWFLTRQDRVYHVTAPILEYYSDFVNKRLYIFLWHCNCCAEAKCSMYPEQGLASALRYLAEIVDCRVAR